MGETHHMFCFIATLLYLKGACNTLLNSLLLAERKQRYSTWADLLQSGECTHSEVPSHKAFASKELIGRCMANDGSYLSVVVSVTTPKNALKDFQMGGYMDGYRAL